MAFLRGIIGSWVPDTLAARLFLLSSCAAILGVVLAALFISSEYRNNAQARLNDILTANIFNLMGNVELGEDGKLMGLPNLGDSRYQLFDSGWYWSVERIGEPERRLASLSLADRAIVLTDGQQFDETFQRNFRMIDENGSVLQGLEAQVFLGEGNRLYSFKITANQSELDEEIFAFTQRIALILGLLAFSIIAATYLVVRLGLKPVTRATQKLTAVRNGDAEKIDGNYPDEIQPLIDETNALIESNVVIVERARTQVGNLAHSLKTPLAVMQNEIASLSPGKRNLFKEQTDTMRQQVQLYLDRARISARRSTSIANTPVFPVLEKLALVVAKLNRNTDMGFELEALQGVNFAGEEPDLQEVFGNLLENAAKYAETTMEIGSEYIDGRIIVTVEDDGPGMTPTQIQNAMKRGGRVDEGKTGWGLGLSIVRDIVEEYEGKFELDSSKLGGLRATVTLPGFKA
ncbi:MAG: ATP-binding protein [Rhizobiaceae bacterium]|nr:ATP-binding protein [Rhizobiaceae bacterium]